MGQEHTTEFASSDEFSRLSIIKPTKRGSGNFKSKILFLFRQINPANIKLLEDFDSLILRKIKY